ncbi:MAG: sigma-70 family RNA polymerase sigma factor [Candidatus Brevundimonas colombiensis]|uniref:Sigma-70 family RNA polymerase sigma factor n=1 Tax=Candidatus Brevundimonas colombiensis TaxID=3121376 RepID=A0AAJ6BJQ7_9CAUL|nr:sigma-70 family RNA polymerase sigma factor [Brevundimonas sp.]WEK40130.1 MAG: sigma-70 family RNA polymerase sigma factor [Brevundimonas sp.]
MADLPASSDLLRLFQDHRSGLVEYVAVILRDPGAAEDVVQDAWIRLQGSEGLAGADRPEAYLYRTVRNLALDRLRRRSFEQRRFVGDELSLATAPEPVPGPEAAAVSRDALRRVMTVMSEMPHRMRTAVAMHRLDGARLKDIAESLGVSVTTAHQLVVEGVERCRAALREHSEK